MSSRRSAAAGAALLAQALVTLPALLGCGNARENPFSTDASVRESPDALAGDGVDAAPGLVDGEGQGPDDVANAGQCFDGRDQDMDGRVDCDEDACAHGAACCVGSTDPACCTSAVEESLPLASCGLDRNPEACPALGARVVSGAPVLGADHTLVPVSSASVDGAVDFPGWQLDPRGETITLTATIRAPGATGQLDATAFGLWAPSLPTASIEPLVAVVVSATRRDVAVVVGDRVVATSAWREGEHSYEITLEPSGLATIRIDGEPRDPLQLALPEQRVVPVVFGRVDNDTVSGGTTRVSALTLRRAACAIPSALVREGELLRADVPGLDETQVTDPSVVVHDGTVHVAFVGRDEGNDTSAIYTSELVDGALESVVRRVATADVAGAVALAGPHLFVDASDRVGMYLAFRDAEGSWHLATIVDLFGAATITPLTELAGSFDDPAWLDDTHLLAREHLADGTTRIVVIVTDETGVRTASDLCAAESSCGPARNDTFVLAPDPQHDAFDHDEVGAPSTLEVGGMSLVHYAGRRGTRWSLGVLVQGGDRSFFRTTNDGAAVLGPSGRGADALGVAAPSAYLDGRDLVLLYAGTDGAHWRLLSARMPIRQ